jgi:predicted regulator of amino acid metabolism with ACT domain
MDNTIENPERRFNRQDPLNTTHSIEVITDRIIKELKEKGELSTQQKFELTEGDIETISTKLAEKIHVKQHPCQFDAETIAALKNLGGLYTSTQTNFKRFIVGVIVTGLIIMLFIGAKHQAQEFLRALGVIK